MTYHVIIAVFTPEQGRRVFENSTCVFPVPECYNPFRDIIELHNFADTTGVAIGNFGAKRVGSSNTRCPLSWPRGRRC